MQLSNDLTLIKDVSKIDMQEIEPIMILEDLSRWNLKPEDFFVIKNKDKNIVAFGRIYTIWEHFKELSSLWVDPNLRWQKLWIYLSEQLISFKKWDDELYLATEANLWKYYTLLWFEIIALEDAPSKFHQTASWARENGIDFIIMKYMG